MINLLIKNISFSYLLKHFLIFYSQNVNNADNILFDNV